MSEHFFFCIRLREESIFLLPNAHLETVHKLNIYRLFLVRMFILFSSINLKCDGRFVLIFIQIDTNGFKSLPEESIVLCPNAHLKTVHKLNNIYRLFLVRMLTLSVNYPIFIPLFLLDQILEVKIYINRVILTTCLAH